MSELEDVAGALAMSYISRTLKSGKNVVIPSLDIVIEGDDVSVEQRFTWKAIGVNGHSEVFGDEFNYTSQDAPVEADEYERMTQRADTLLAERDAATQRAEAAEVQLRYVAENLSVFLATQDAICGDRLRRWIAEWPRA